MNDDTNEQILKTLKRIEQFLEAIDWKIWNFHEYLLGSKSSHAETVSATEDEETAELAAVIESPKIAEKPAEVKKPTYPSIEKWS